MLPSLFCLFYFLFRFISLLRSRFAVLPLCSFCQVVHCIFRSFVSFLSQVVSAWCSYSFILSCFDADELVEESDGHTCAGSRGHFSCQFVNCRHMWRRLTGCPMVHSVWFVHEPMSEFIFSFSFFSVLHRFSVSSFSPSQFSSFLRLRCCWLQCRVPGPSGSTDCDLNFLSALRASIVLQFSSPIFSL